MTRLEEIDRARAKRMREESQAALVVVARATIDEFRKAWEGGLTVGPEFHRALQRLHIACEAVECLPHE